MLATTQQQLRDLENREIELTTECNVVVEDCSTATEAKLVAMKQQKREDGEPRNGWILATQEGFTSVANRLKEMETKVEDAKVSFAGLKDFQPRV